MNNLLQYLTFAQYYYSRNLLQFAPMKNYLSILVFLVFSCAFSQQIGKFQTHKNITPSKQIEDRNGKIITDSVEKKLYLLKRQEAIHLNNSHKIPAAKLQTAVHLCSNGNFEEFQTVGTDNVLTNFAYTTGDPLNPMQCKSIDVDANQYINQYNPANFGLMATTVPSNFIDEFIGNINAFDQYTLKINYKESGITSAVVQARRFKTNNETSVKFNYKAVLQSISESGHLNEQPGFKVRIIRSNGTVIGESCLIGDPTNCIFTQAPVLEGGNIVLYTPNWQSGIIDISMIPNNEEFTIEFQASRCGLGGHFGYVYVDDICLLHSNENLQGSIELDPLYKICPTMPVNVCGSFTIPNSGGVSASVNSVTLNVHDATNNIIYTTSTPLTLDLINKKFCFQLTAANLVNVTTGNYNVSVVINYGVLQSNCLGTSFNTATDDDANPGWDIAFMNCTPTCAFTLQPGSIVLCDANHNGKEFFNLTNANTIVAGAVTGLTFAYFTNLTDATNNTNPIATPTNFESYSSSIFIRVTKDPTCFKIIAFQLIVKNPSATISGILNVCSGGTTLTASPGVSYVWSNGATGQSTVVSTPGTHTVTVTDLNGCVSTASVTIIANSVAVLPTIQVIQPTCFVTTGTITVTSVASEVSFDDGVTWSTNLQMTNAPIGNYLVKIKTASGCMSYSSPVNVIPFALTFPSYNSVQPTACGSLGSITITTVGTEYSFDDGLTWTTNNVATNLPAGTYLIRTKNQFGCISNNNSALLVAEFLGDPTYIIDNPYCGNLGSITITSPADQYSFDGGTTWQTSNVFSNLTAGSYVIKIKDSQGCTSSNVYVYLEDLESSYPQYTIDEAGCNKYATLTITSPADYYSFDGGITWTTNNVLSNLNGGSSFQIKIKRGLTCESYSNYVYIYSTFLPLPAASDFATIICDNLNDGSETVNLTNYDTNLIASSTNYTFTYYNTLTGAENQDGADQINSAGSYNLNATYKTIYVRVTDSNGCGSVVTLDLTLLASPIITLADQYYLCQNSVLAINGTAGFDTYLWSDGSTAHSIVITQADVYTLTVTKDHATPFGIITCSTTKAFTVTLSNPATILPFETHDWTVDNNIITVNIASTSLGDYEYSLNGIDYQDSNVFYDLGNGEYTVYVKDKHGCGIRTGDTYLLMYPKFFTPNADSFNDFWKIKFSDNEPNLMVKIFDRYGKFITAFGVDSQGWDGNYLGLPSVATDYWFVVTRQNGMEHKGHFTLKR